MHLLGELAIALEQAVAAQEEERESDRTMKLKRYLKPYIGFALAAIVLMFCQAAVDLNLPNLMSDIVNVGIQQGGITEAAPKAVSAEGLQL